MVAVLSIQRSLEVPPSARARGSHLAGPLAALAPRLPGIDGPHRSVAAAALAVRGDQGRNRAGFAAAYGLTEDEVFALESGWTGLEQLPIPLAVLTPLASLAHRVGS